MVRKLPVAGWDFDDSKPGMYLERKSDKWVFRKSYSHMHSTVCCFKNFQLVVKEQLKYQRRHTCTAVEYFKISGDQVLVEIFDTVQLS